MSQIDTLTVRVPVIISVALEVISGKYGNNEDRIQQLRADGYDPDLVQRCVNDLYALVEKYEG